MSTKNKRILHFIKRISRLMRVLADELDDFALELDKEPKKRRVK